LVIKDFFLLKAHPGKSSIVLFRRKGRKITTLWCQHTAKIEFDYQKWSYLLCALQAGIWHVTAEVELFLFLNKSLLSTSKD